MKKILAVLALVIATSPAFAEGKVESTMTSTPAAIQAAPAATKDSLLQRIKVLSKKSEDIATATGVKKGMFIKSPLDEIPLKLAELEELMTQDMISTTELQSHLDALDTELADGLMSEAEVKTWMAREIKPIK